MEQQNGAPGSASSQAARTVLPGEPFEPPMSAQLPGPRPPEQLEAPAPVAHWNYQPTEPAYGPSHENPPVPGMTFAGQPPMAPMTPITPITPMAPMAADGTAPGAYPVGGGDVNSLHDYASLPVTGQHDAPPAHSMQAYPPPVPPPSPESGWPAAAAMPQQPIAAQYAPGQPPQQFAPMPAASMGAPLAPHGDDAPGVDGGHRRAARKSVDKRLLALIGAVVIGGGGYLAYNQFGKSDTSTAATPVPVAAAPVVAKYAFPAKLDGLSLRTTPAAAQLRAAEAAVVKARFPTIARTMTFATYATGTPGVTAFTLHPARAQLATSYANLLRLTATPAKGNATVAYHTAQPGAAGGAMQCGGQRGATPYAYCVFRGTSTIGVLTVTGSPSSSYAEIYTREMRAYAEH